MARPRGRTKTARLTVNLEPREYASLCALARKQDVPVSWLIRRVINTYLGSGSAGELLDEQVSASRSSLARRAGR